MDDLEFKEYQSKRSAGAIIEALKVTQDNMVPIFLYYFKKNNYPYSARCRYDELKTRIQIKVKVLDVMRREIETKPGDWLVKDQEEGFHYVLDDKYFKENYQEKQEGESNKNES